MRFTSNLTGRIALGIPLIMEKLKKCEGRDSYVRASGEFLKALSLCGIEPEEVLTTFKTNETLKNLDDWARQGMSLMEHYSSKQSPLWQKVATKILAAKGRQFGLQKIRAVLNPKFDKNPRKALQPLELEGILSEICSITDEVHQTVMRHTTREQSTSLLPRSGSIDFDSGMTVEPNPQEESDQDEPSNTVDGELKQTEGARK
jgi:hypothetical protein